MEQLWCLIELYHLDVHVHGNFLATNYNNNYIIFLMADLSSNIRDQQITICWEQTTEYVPWMRL